MNREPKHVLSELLVLQAQTGDEAAFRRLHELWRADLQRLALARVEQPVAAGEVGAEVWLDIARGLRRLEDPARFPAWAMRIVQRRSADWVRQRSRDRRREAAAAGNAEELAPSAGPAEPADAVLRLRQAICRLPADKRELLHLFYDLGRSVAEVAEILGLAPGTVKSRLFSVREILKQQLEGKSHE
ncbi:MAG: polymerase sigma factor SigE [Verrucomicrobiota bacterium]|jgi:RNA polymerase sigma-70 factor (ECF subfamily)